jgi:6-phosphogluconolactonase
MRSLSLTVPLLAVCLAPFLPASAAQPQGQFIVYVGTYTQKESKGIYAWRFDAASGKLAPLGLAAETVNPTFLALRPDRRFLYSVSEIASFDGQKSGAVSAFGVDLETGKLKFINKIASRGTGPCFVSVDHTGRELVMKVDPTHRHTPTLGRKKSFFDELFGNIGQVGAGGIGGPTQPQ